MTQRYKTLLNINFKISFFLLTLWKEFEIKKYLFNHPEIEHFCIIDDDDLDDLAIVDDEELDEDN